MGSAGRSEPSEPASQGRVSVLIPVRNGAATLAEALKSVLGEAQTGEVIVVDDGSTDGSGEIARRCGDARLRVVEGPRAGISAALNAGLEEARLEFVARCDADDRFVHGRLERQVDWLDAHPDHVAISGAYATMTAGGRKVAELSHLGGARDVTEELLRGVSPTHFCTWLVRRRALVALGGARTWFATGEDLDLQFRLAALGRVWHDPRPAYLYRLHDTSITHSEGEGRMQFYEAAARRFAQQRLERGEDDLDAGRPPDIAEVDARPAMRAAMHAAGQLEGAAWRLVAEGRRREAARAMAHALSLDPTDRRRWRSALALLIRMVR